ncbi:MAG: TetR/AcrR family transcriptional regulator [Gammaproteobacteria bacterium]|nr:TetR/AcrR family transcriptional regulator [Gammaproteobacteria bacterium]
MKSKDRRSPRRDEVRLPDPTAVAKGELAKSGVTRRRIMDAAVRCLAERGYSATTTTEVAKAADLTRAAMLYHFPSRMALIEATIHYVTKRRLDMYESAMAEIPHDRNYFISAIDIAWEQLQTPEFLAFTELSLASRSDRELSAIFTPALAEYDRARRATATRLFPPDQAVAPWFDLRRDIVRFLLEGLAQQGGLSFDAQRRQEMIIGFLKALATTREAEVVLRKAEDWTRR